MMKARFFILIFLLSVSGRQTIVSHPRSDEPQRPQVFRGEDIPIDQVTVTAKNKVRQKMAKNIRLRHGTFEFAEHRYSFTLTDPSGRIHSGEFHYAELPNYYKNVLRETGVMTIRNEEYHLQCDLDSLLAAVHRNAVFLLPTKEDIQDGSFTEVSDAGNQYGDGLNHYNVNIKFPQSEGRRIKIKLCSDPRTREIVSTSTHIEEDCGREMKTNAYFRLSDQHKIIYPDSINAVCTVLDNNDTLRYDITFKSLVLKRYPRSLFVKEPKKYSTFRLGKNEKAYNSMIRKHVYPSR